MSNGLTPQSQRTYPLPMRLPTATGGGGGAGIQDLVSGGMSMLPGGFLPAMGLKFGGGIMNMLGGGGKRKRRKKAEGDVEADRAALMGMFDEDPFSVQNIMMMLTRGMQGEEKRRGANIAKLSGNYSAADAQAALHEGSLSNIANIQAMLAERLGLANVQRKTGIRTTLLGESSNRLQSLA